MERQQSPSPRETSADDLGGSGSVPQQRQASRSPPESATTAAGVRSPRAASEQLRRERSERERERERQHERERERQHEREREQERERHRQRQHHHDEYGHHGHGHGGHQHHHSHSHHSPRHHHPTPPAPHHTPRASLATASYSPRQAHTNPHYAHGHPHGHYTPRGGGGPVPLPTVVASPRASGGGGGHHSTAHGSGSHGHGGHGGSGHASSTSTIGLGLSTGTSRTPSPPTPVDDPDWTDGEFVLESTDFMRFRVPSYYLFAASAAFRDAAASASATAAATRPDPDMDGHADDAPHGHYVRFSDAGETAAVIRLFLEFIVYARVEVPDDGTTLDSLRCMRAIVLFLKRYDCLPTLQLYLTCLREVVRQPSNISPLAAFVAGATAGDAFTCSTALDITDWVWRMMDRQNLPASPDANVFDPHHMPVAVWQLIPPMYTWALTTAWTGTEEHLHRHSSHGRRGMSDGSSSVGELVSRKVHSWQQWL